MFRYALNPYIDVDRRFSGTLCRVNHVYLQLGTVGFRFIGN